jgi:hypothetical protein
VEEAPLLLMLVCEATNLRRSRAMSSERRGAELLLGSIRAFRSLLLKVMVAVWRRWLQRGGGEEPQNSSVAIVLRGRRSDLV